MWREELLSRYLTVFWASESSASPQPLDKVSTVGQDVPGRQSHEKLTRNATRDP
jgi:hypothetical protein